MNHHGKMYMPSPLSFNVDPKEGSEATEKTLVDILYDDDAIYIGARMYDSDPTKIEARLGRKDVVLTSDSFYVYIDPFHDKRTRLLLRHQCSRNSLRWHIDE